MCGGIVYNPQANIFTFTSGLKLSPVARTIGIDDKLQAYTGWDDTLTESMPTYFMELSPTDRIELADYMISLWQAFKKAKT